MDFGSCVMQGVACEKGESVYEASNNCEYGPHRENVVEVSYDVVCVV